jgi:hypothetical protein
MAKYRKKPVVIEAITFDEFVEYGKTMQNHWLMVNLGHLSIKGILLHRKIESAI